jgi:hypothetical protein
MGALKSPELDQRQIAAIAGIVNADFEPASPLHMRLDSMMNELIYGVIFYACNYGRRDDIPRR